MYASMHIFLNSEMRISLYSHNNVFTTCFIPVLLISSNHLSPYFLSTLILTAWWRSRLTRKTPLLLLSSGNSTSIKAQHVICRSRRVLVGGITPPQPGGQRFYPERGPPRLLTPLGRGEGIRSRFFCISVISTSCF